MILLLFLLLTGTLHAQLSSGASLSNVTIGQATPLSITSSSCPSGIEGNAYTCTLVATGGTIPYNWTLLSRKIRYLPVGLTLGANGVISGTPTGTGASNFVIQVQDASSPIQTASVSLSINVVSASACGFPHYNCARNDWTTQPFDSMTTLPPDIGCQSEQVAYVTGTVDYRPCTTLNHCTAGADGHLQACGNLYGLNTVITDPNYNNAVILRASDYNDNLDGCVPQIGPGGSAGYNIFDITSTYFVVSCGGGGSRLKWLNPAIPQIVTTKNKMGYVLASIGSARFFTTNSLRSSHTEAHKFYSWDATGKVTYYTVTDGVISDPSAPIVDYGFAVPCWHISCNGWQHTTYNPGSNILPTNSNASPPHSFQLINTSACTTGTSEPNWLPATPDGPSGSAANSGLPTAALKLASVYVLTDGSCQWADMGNPSAGIKWTASPFSDITDRIFYLAFSNRGGQDGVGACYTAVYNSTNNTYSHWNTCTGNVYNTTCNGGAGYNCTGGSFVQSYVGNTYTDNPFPGGRNAAMNIHSGGLSLNAQWSEMAFNNCSLWDLTANTTIKCLSTASNPNGGLNVYYWHPFSSEMRNANDYLRAPVIPNANQIAPVCCPGHDMFGANRYVWRATSMYQGVNYPVTDFSTNTTVKAFDVSTPPVAGGCAPNTCWTTGSRIIRPVNWDQHSSWASNDGSDTEAPCTEIYTASGGFNDTQSLVPAGGTAWPPRFPWISEAVCFSVDGTNRIAREAYSWNSGSSWRFNSMFQIGSLSNDGAWWAFNSDWWCTMGAENGSLTNMCALFYQVLHTYNTLGELVASNTGNSTSRPPITYQITATGTTTRDNVSWCNTANCTVTNGGVTMTRVGQNTAQTPAANNTGGMGSIFLVKLQ